MIKSKCYFSRWNREKMKKDKDWQTKLISTLNRTSRHVIIQFKTKILNARGTKDGCFQVNIMTTKFNIQKKRDLGFNFLTTSGRCCGVRGQSMVRVERLLYIGTSQQPGLSGQFSRYSIFRSASLDKKTLMTSFPQYREIWQSFSRSVPGFTLKHA